MPVIKGKIRGNGGQLASYLLATGENEQVRILDVDGMAAFSDMDLRNLLKDFSRNEQLTKSRQGIYHASINPEEKDASRMKDEDWQVAADMLAAELGFAGQRRAIVLHQKHGRTHAHIALERYDHEKKKMIAIDHNYRKQDKARAKIEQTFRHHTTPVRNPRRPQMKDELTKIWQQTPDALSFIRKAREQGYQISTDIGRMPFMVVDGTGRSFNLVRQLDGIHTKEVRQRFKDTVLLSEKEAIALARTQEAVTGARARERIRAEEAAKQEKKEPGKEKTAREAFRENLEKQRRQQQARQTGPRMR